MEQLEDRAKTYDPLRVCELRRTIEEDIETYLRDSKIVRKNSSGTDYPLPKIKGERHEAISVLRKIIDCSYDELSKTTSEIDKKKERVSQIGALLGLAGAIATYRLSSELAHSYSQWVNENFHYLASGLSWIGQATISLIPPTFIGIILRNKINEVGNYATKGLQQKLDSQRKKKNVAELMLMQNKN